MEDKKFEPLGNITKAQVAQVLYNMDGQPEVTNTDVFLELKEPLFTSQPLKTISQVHMLLR